MKVTMLFPFVLMGSTGGSRSELRRLVADSTQNCSTDNCSAYDSFSDLVLALEQEDISSLCLCPRRYQPDDSYFGSEGGILGIPFGQGSCGNATEGGNNTIVIPKNRELEMICADSQNCFFACPDKVFQVEGSLALHNFSLAGVVAYGPGDSRIQVEATGSLLFEDSYISLSQTAGQGGAIKSLGGTVVIRNSILTNCIAAEEGGAIYSSGTLEIHDSMILSSKSEVAGGGAFLDSNSSTLLNNARFNFNEGPSGETSGVYLASGASIEGCGELLHQSTFVKTTDGDVVAEIEPCNNPSGSSTHPRTAAASITFLVGLGLIAIVN